MTSPVQPPDRVHQSRPSAAWNMLKEMLRKSLARRKPEREFTAGDQMTWLAQQTAPDSAATREDLLTEDRRLFLTWVLSERFQKECKCDVCAPALYFNPSSCLAGHRRSDLYIPPRHGPVTQQVGPILIKFEALQLANEMIRFFDRDREYMSPSQLDALVNFQIMKDDLLKELNQADCSHIRHSVMVEAIGLLNGIFFMGMIGEDITFTWEQEDEQLMDGGFGSTVSVTHSRTDVRHTIWVNPVDTPVRAQTTPASVRIGILLHEMLHAFIHEHACTNCYTSPDNVCSGDRQSHGRAWHRMAMALELCAPELLGVPNLDLGRLSMLQMWIERSRGSEDSTLWAYGPIWRPTIHDVCSFGFV